MVDTLGFANAVTGAPSYTGRKLRQLNGVGFAGATAARPLGARSGVRPGTPSTTVTATASTWTVQPHAGLIDMHTAVEAGPFAFAFDAVATGAVAAASAFARVDIVYVQVDDPAESDGSSVPAVTRKYLAGLVAGTPQTLPARSILLAHINVPLSGGGSPTVTWKAPYCAAAGGVLDFNTKAELDAWTTAAPSQMAFVLADKAFYKNDGTVWKIWATTVPIAYTPTWTQFSIGNGTQVVQYTVSAGVVTVTGDVQVGTTTGFTGLAFYPSMPIPPLAGTAAPIGPAWAFDSSATLWYTGIFAKDYFLFPQRAINSYPFPWAAPDLLRWSCSYSI